MGQHGPDIRPTTSPLWTVEPYADQGACWGCGLVGSVPAGGPFVRYTLCFWCAELLAIDKANQRRERDSGWPGRML